MAKYVVAGWSGEREKVIMDEIKELSIRGIGWDIHVGTEVTRVRSGWRWGLHPSAKAFSDLGDGLEGWWMTHIGCVQCGTVARWHKPQGAGGFHMWW